jgi:hypothetical protein
MRLDPAGEFLCRQLHKLLGDLDRVKGVLGVRWTNRQGFAFGRLRISDNGVRSGFAPR